MKLYVICYCDSLYLNRLNAGNMTIHMMSCIEGTYRLGTFLKIMLEKISPSKVIVYGAMPNDIFDGKSN